MTPSERKIVRRDQIQSFITSYFVNWRLNQILTFEKLLFDKHSFFKDIVQETKQLDDNLGEATISQEITNGIYFDAIASSIQYIEDLFALLNAAKNPDFFIKNIITYKAGKIDDLIQKRYTEKEILKMFYFPHCEKSEEEDAEIRIRYDSGVSVLCNYIGKIQEYYKQYIFFYIQHKHGLTLALRPFRLLQEEQIKKDKEGDLEPYLAAFDNLAINKLKGEDIRFNKMVFMPGFTEPIRKNITELHNENNLIRYVHPPIDTSIDKIKSIAYKTRDCINIIMHNLYNFLQDELPMSLRLPMLEKGKAVLFKFPDNPFVL